MTTTVKLSLPRRIEEITAEWVTSVLAPRYSGTVVEELYIGTVIAGTATKVRLMLAYNEAGHRHQLPPTMWLKGGFIRHDFTFDDSFVKEAKFFANWANEMSINIPKAYYAGWEEGVQGLVLLEDLAARNATFGNATRPISVDQQAQIVEQLAVMHARWWQSPELKQLKNYSTVWEAADKVVMMTLQKESFDSCMSKRRCQAITGAYRDREKVLAAMRAQWARARTVPQVFSHGDSHLGNMFFEHDGTPGFLDWQAWMEGPYIDDLAYSIIGNITVEDRRKTQKDLLATYLAALADNGVANPPTREEAWEAYRWSALHGFNWAFCPVEMQPEDIVTAEADLFGVAVSDLDSFGAVGV